MDMTYSAMETIHHEDKHCSGLQRTKRDAPPSHFSLTIESFSLLQKTKVDKYEFEVFEFGNEKWRLCFYPNGNAKGNGNGNGHISLALKLEKDNTSPNNWYLDTELKFFVHDKINNEYLAVEDGQMKRFDMMKTEWCFDQFLPLDIFNNASNGYLIEDCCTFGAEIVVIENPTGIHRRKRDAPPMHYSFTVKSFSMLQEMDVEKYRSQVFDVGHEKWRLCLYPNGNANGNGEGHISLSLKLEKEDPSPNDWHLDVEVKLFVHDKINNKYLVVQDGQLKRFDMTKTECCCDQFLPLETFNNASNGYLVDDCCTFGAEVVVIENPTNVLPPILDKNSPILNNLRYQEPGILRTKRDAPPMHHLFMVESFSCLRKTKVDKYESEVFEVGNVKWRLCLYPNRNTNGDGNDYISLSLMLEKDNPFPKDWYLNVEFKLFVQDKINNKYLGVQDGQMKRFDMIKTEWCLDQFLSLETFNNASNGYLVDDCCTFGAEIVVIENPNIVPSTISDRNSAMPNKPCSQVPGMLRTKRDAPPAHYSFTVESFSLMQQMELEKYESEVFEVANEKWRLCLYPNGNTKGNGKGHISLSLELETNNPSPPGNWHLDVELKLFVQDKINNKYLVVQDGEAKRFDKLNTEWGLDQFLSSEVFKNYSNGYLVNDCCTFGVEIFVISNPTGKFETLSMVKNPANGSLTWKVEDFSKLDKTFYQSPEFTAGERSWKLKVFPRGYEEGRGNFLSILLQLADANKFPPKKKVGAKFKLRVLNKNQEKTLESTHTAWFSYPDVESWGQRKFVRLGDLHETSKGFVVDDDTLTVEVEILCISISKTKIPSSAGNGIQKTKRDYPPLHYSLTVESFSILQETKMQYYESETFEVEREKWRLRLYPNGNTKGNGKDHISISLKLDKDKYPSNDWHLDVKLNFFVQDKINNQYLAVQDGETKRFNAEKTEWGIDQFLSFDTFNDAANGYLVKDCCSVGAEIFVTENPSGNRELLSMVKQPAHSSFKWKLQNFSKLDDKSYDSPAFTAGERSWKISVYPKGKVSGKGKFLSMYLELVDGKKLPPKVKVWAEYKLRVVNQNQAGKSFEEKYSSWFSPHDTNWGWGRHEYMPLEDLHNSSKGFITGDGTLTVEAEILFISISKVVS